MDGVFYINKPKGMTSFDVVAQLRRRLKERSIGHTGTLDPNAEGLLIILVGKACKILPYCEHDKKEYCATMQFGEKRSTGDIWGDIVETKEVTEVSRKDFEEILTSFLGESMQTPPMTSAIKINGKKLIEYQRQGIHVDVPAREIRVYEMECLDFDGGSAQIRALVSKGTYIRTLCEDIAKATGNIGTMSSLVRTRIGSISLDKAVRIDDLNEDSIPHSINEVLQGTLPMIETEKLTEVMQGKKLEFDSFEDIILLTHKEEVIAAYERVDGKVYRSKRGLW